MNLEELPGVGPQLAVRLRSRFGGDDAFAAAARALDLDAISAVDGVSERRAVELVRAVTGMADTDTFLATPAARRVHDGVMARLLSFAATRHGRNRLRLLGFHPDPDGAQAHAAAVLAEKATVAGLDRDRVRRLLRRIRPLEATRPRAQGARLVVAETDAIYERLQDDGVNQWAALGTPRDLQDAASYDVVVLVYDEGAVDAGGLANVVEVPAGAGLDQVCPEAVLEPLRSHRDTVEAAGGLAQLLDRPSVAPDLLALLDQTQGGGMADPAQVRKVIESVRAQLDSEVQEQVSGLALSGTELLAAMTAGTLPAPLQAVVDEALRTGRRQIQEATGVDLQAFQSTLPLRIDEDEVERVLGGLAARDRLAAFQAGQKAAAQVATLQPRLVKELQGWLEWDARFALGCFAWAHDLRPFRFTDRLHFADSVHLDLAANPEAQRIAYHLGGPDAENVAVLTGANSGGKSTLLQHACQLVVMARMGLPVVGRDVTVPWLDEVHLVTARRGLDAGAFETFLRSFLPVVQGDARRLVLVDEVEAVTELEAAGRILAFVLDRLAATQSLAVVVTHLAPQVLQHVQTAQVRVDGIEATGLDEDHRLVVDRNPRIGTFARSTPELIVRRLAATTRGDERALFEDLLGVFEASGTVPAIVQGQG